MSELARQTQNRNLLFPALMVTTALAMAALGYWLSQSLFSTGPGIAENISERTLRLVPPKPIAPFTLVKSDQSPFTKTSLQGKWSVLFFGYTRCPDVCPGTLSTLNQAIELMSNQNPDKSLPQVVFVSVDPERDRPEHIGEYARYFNDGFIAVTGESDDLEQFTRQIGVLYFKTGEVESENYLIDHTASLALINPEGDLAALISTPHVAEGIARDLAEIVHRG